MHSKGPRRLNCLYFCLNIGSVFLTTDSVRTFSTVKFLLLFKFYRCSSNSAGPVVACSGNNCIILIYCTIYALKVIMCLNMCNSTHSICHFGDNFTLDYCSCNYGFDGAGCLRKNCYTN